MDEQLLEQLCRLTKQGERVALVTVIDSRGSTPRKAGAKMLVTGDGAIFGTIGGGCSEAEVRQQALMVLDNGQPCRYTVTLLNDVAAEEGMVCGGVMDVFIQLVS
ncbi:MAG TPA: XdhC family protein [Patescibacteria group bacterium]|nr:XdhC family protein [Patescibacteria group bacterium]